MASETSVDQGEPELVNRLSRPVQIGRGGYSTVWCLEDSQTGRKYAEKRASTPEAGSVLKKEYAFMAGLNSPVIEVKYLLTDVDTSEVRMGMEYVDGPQLDRIKGTFGVLPVVLSLFNIARYLRDNNIVHQDLKPANILPTADYKAKVADFGNAKRTEESPEKVTKRVIIGTPCYMSPEHIDLQGVTNHGSDIYSLTSTIFELLTGEAAFPDPNIRAILLEIMGDNNAEAKRRSDRLRPLGYSRAVREALVRGWDENKDNRDLGPLELELKKLYA